MLSDACLRLRNVAVGRNAVCKPDIAADGRAAANRDPSQNRSAGVDHHVIFDDWVTRISFDQSPVVIDRKAPRAERDRLIDAHALRRNSDWP
jgi:hypothetical protein